MFNVELSTPESAGRSAVALRGELDVAHAPGVASHLTTAVTIYGPWVVVDMTGLEYIGSAGLPGPWNFLNGLAWLTVCAGARDLPRGSGAKSPTGGCPGAQRP